MNKKLIGAILAVLGLTTVGCSNQTTATKDDNSEITITMDDIRTLKEASGTELNESVEGQLVHIDISQIEIDSQGIRVKTQIQNKTDKIVIVQVRNLQVDDMMVEDDTIFSSEINGNARDINNIEIYNNDGKLDDYQEDVKMIKTIKGKFVVLDSEYNTLEEIDFEINK